MKEFILAFIPVFVAVDPIGLLPIFVTLTAGTPKQELNKIIVQSLGTAVALAVGFIFLGKIIFKVLGITMADFMVAGGAILFCIAIADIVQTGRRRPIPAGEMGAVPIGTPLIVGPAVLTTSLMMIDIHGLVPTLLAVLFNLFLVGLMFWFSDTLIRSIGQSGARVLSKLMGLLLAAIAIMMIRKGIFRIISPDGIM